MSVCVGYLLCYVWSAVNRRKVSTVREGEKEREGDREGERERREERGREERGVEYY